MCQSAAHHLRHATHHIGKATSRVTSTLHAKNVVRADCVQAVDSAAPQQAKRA
jgi:hypothetical protein